MSANPSSSRSVAFSSRFRFRGFLPMPETMEECWHRCLLRIRLLYVHAKIKHLRGTILLPTRETNQNHSLNLNLNPNLELKLELNPPSKVTMKEHSDVRRGFSRSNIMRPCKRIRKRNSNSIISNLPTLATATSPATSPTTATSLLHPIPSTTWDGPRRNRKRGSWNCRSESTESNSCQNWMTLMFTSS